MAEKTENTYHYLWIKRKNESWDYYYYSPGITKTQAKEILDRDSTIIDYELTDSEDGISWAVPM